MKNKFLKKISNIFGYKLIEKNLVKNNQLLSENSILNIKLVLDNIFRKKKNRRLNSNRCK